jgi:hypothetical protein
VCRSGKAGHDTATVRCRTHYSRRPLDAFTAESFGGPDRFSRELDFAHLMTRDTEIINHVESDKRKADGAFRFDVSTN